MNLPRRRLTIAQIMIGVALCALVVKWPILLIPATWIGPKLIADKYGLSLVEFLVLISLLGCCIGLWLPYFHERHVPHTLRSTLELLAITTGVIASGGTMFWMLMRWRLHRRSTKTANLSSATDAADPLAAPASRG
jgi:hypothetical protein